MSILFTNLITTIKIYIRMFKRNIVSVIYNF